MLGGLLPRIPNLELGFLYNIGINVRSGRLYADYLVPFGLGGNSVIFGEAHGEFQDFWKRPHVATGAAPGYTATKSRLNNRTDLSFGGGYRKVLGNSKFLGINAFYDSTRLYGKWYASGGVGLEMVTFTPGNGAVDVNFNWYGNLINRSELINAFRNRAGSWDIEAGISQPLFDQGLDLRLSGTAYDFNIGSAVYGWRTGAELTTRNGFFTLKYEYGHEKVNGSYNTIGGYVNVGCQLENLVRRESPFTAPQPVFGSPRNLWRLLTHKVRRNWHLPATVLLQREVSLAAGGEAPLFTTTTSVGPVGNGTQVATALNQPITAADIVGANRVVITWDSGVAPSGLVDVQLVSVGGGACSGAHVNLNGGASPPGVVTTNSSFWNITCGSWDTLVVTNLSGSNISLGLMTLSFFP